MKIIYINGISVTEEEAQVQKAYLNSILNHEVTLCYNPTMGFLADMAESFYNRVFSWAPSLPTTRKLSRQIESYLLMREKVTVIAHSQGTAIAANALRDLNLERSCYRGLVSAVFFASINSHEPKGVAGEIYLHDQDFVHSSLIVGNFFIGLMRIFKEPCCNWRKFTSPGFSHSLIEGYLQKLGEFKGFKDSHFWRLGNSD